MNDDTEPLPERSTKKNAIARSNPQNRLPRCACKSFVVSQSSSSQSQRSSRSLSADASLHNRCCSSPSTRIATNNAVQFETEKALAINTSSQHRRSQSSPARLIPYLNGTVLSAPDSTTAAMLDVSANYQLQQHQQFLPTPSSSIQLNLIPQQPAITIIAQHQQELTITFSTTNRELSQADSITIATPSVVKNTITVVAPSFTPSNSNDIVSNVEGYSGAPLPAIRSRSPTAVTFNMAPTSATSAGMAPKGVGLPTLARPKTAPKRTADANNMKTLQSATATTTTKPLLTSNVPGTGLASSGLPKAGVLKSSIAANNPPVSSGSGGVGQSSVAFQSPTVTVSNVKPITAAPAPKFPAVASPKQSAKSVAAVAAGRASAPLTDLSPLTVPKIPTLESKNLPQSVGTSRPPTPVETVNLLKPPSPTLNNAAVVPKVSRSTSPLPAPESPTGSTAQPSMQTTAPSGASSSSNADNKLTTFPTTATAFKSSPNSPRPNSLPTASTPKTAPIRQVPRSSPIIGSSPRMVEDNVTAVTVNQLHAKPTNWQRDAPMSSGDDAVVRKLSGDTLASRMNNTRSDPGLAGPSHKSTNPTAAPATPPPPPPKFSKQTEFSLIEEDIIIKEIARVAETTRTNQVYRIVLNQKQARMRRLGCLSGIYNWMQQKNTAAAKGAMSPHSGDAESRKQPMHRQSSARLGRTRSSRSAHKIYGSPMRSRGMLDADLSFDPDKLYNFGEKGSGFRSKGDPQDFIQLRDQCLADGVLFEDPDFPANSSSLTFDGRTDRYFQWKRPREISSNPQLFVDGYSRFDVQQGELGDCWLLAAVANLTLHRRLFMQIVPEDQDFEENYAGIFHFRFWQYGRWVDVVVDDRLPTYNDQLVYLRSAEQDEFWSALLEKAYAKLHGCYEALKGGSTCEAMEDFTGGVTEMYELNASPPHLFQILLKAYERSSLMGCSIEPDPEVFEAQTPEGLIRGHAYSITRIKYVHIRTPNTNGKIPLLRLRNPWGNEAEWKGAWSDNSPEWRYIPDSEKRELGLNFDHDGEFWMSYKDFQKHFSRVEICNLNPDSLDDDELTGECCKKWEMSIFEGEWVRGVTAGGCRNFIDTFWHNPQYRITLTEVDEGDGESKCTLIVALMQKNRRLLRTTNNELLTIGFVIYFLPNPERAPKPLNLNFFRYNASVARSPSFINLREVSCRFKLPPGTYCIIPSTFDPNEEGEFLLRVFSEHKNNMEENDKDTIGYDGDHAAKKKTVSQQLAPLPVSDEAAVPLEEVHEFFVKVAGPDGVVDWTELQQVLNFTYKRGGKRSANAPKPSEFTKDICQSLVAMLDKDRSGTLDYEEFTELLELIRYWKQVFHTHDTDHSGTFTNFELSEALSAAGYQLNNRILNQLMHRYGNRQGEMDLEDFLLCTIKLRTMIDVFKEKDTNAENVVTFSIEEWLEKTLYC